MTLLIMAAGMGSRFGGLKQIEGVGPNNEFIIDYSIYDAIEAGFDKVVFIIKEENYEVFKETIGSRIDKHIEVSYVFQKTENIPKGYDYYDRIKPWGTSHAILAAKDIIKENFAVINADDFYGRDTFMKIGEFLKNEDPNSNHFAMAGYKIANTMTLNGSVKRGICQATDGYLDSLVESIVERKDSEIVATPLNGNPSFSIAPYHLVSMNCFGFTPKLFDYLLELQDEFFEDNKEDLSKCEFLIPESCSKLINSKIIDMKVLDTNSVWYGITYKEDKDLVVEALKKMIEDKIYPNNLW